MNSRPRVPRKQLIEGCRSLAAMVGCAHHITDDGISATWLEADLPAGEREWMVRLVCITALATDWRPALDFAFLSHGLGDLTTAAATFSRACSTGPEALAEWMDRYATPAAA